VFEGLRVSAESSPPIRLHRERAEPDICVLFSHPPRARSCIQLHPPLSLSNPPPPLPRFLAREQRCVRARAARNRYRFTRERLLPYAGPAEMRLGRATSRRVSPANCVSLVRNNDRPWHSPVLTSRVNDCGFLEQRFINPFTQVRIM